MKFYLMVIILTVSIKAFANDDDAIIVIKPTAPIAGCRGFAIVKEVSSKNVPKHEEILTTWVGFEENETDSPDNIDQTFRFVRYTFSGNYFAQAGAGVLSLNNSSI